MLRLIDGEGLGNPMLIGRVGEIPAGFLFNKRDRIGAIAVDFVRRHVDEWRFGARSAGGFEEIEGADGVGIEVIERDCRGSIVAGLRGGVDDGVGPNVGQESENLLAIADIQFVVCVVGERTGQSLLIPARIAGGAEEVAR